MFRFNPRRLETGSCQLYLGELFWSNTCLKGRGPKWKCKQAVTNHLITTFFWKHARSLNSTTKHSTHKSENIVCVLLASAGHQICRVNRSTITTSQKTPAPHCSSPEKPETSFLYAVHFRSLEPFCCTPIHLHFSILQKCHHSIL